MMRKRYDKKTGGNQGGYRRGNPGEIPRENPERRPGRRAGGKPGARRSVGRNESNGIYGSKPDFGRYSKPDAGKYDNDCRNAGSPAGNINRNTGSPAGDIDKLEGRNPVIEALKSGRSINKILVSRGDREGSIRQIIALAREMGVVVQEVERTVLDGMSASGSHQGVIAYTAVKSYVEVDDILETARQVQEQPFIIVLDGIADAQNLGSIMRTADATGAHGIIIPKRRAVGLTSAVSKASAGAVEHVQAARVANLAQTLEHLKKNGLWVVGADMAGEKPFYKSDLKGPIALVIGGEGEGIGKLVRDKCDFLVSIPMRGKISSLNAAIAGAVVMYEILRQRSGM